MVLVEGGVLVQGSVDFYPEEQPVREVPVGDLWVGLNPVTNAEFRRFVKDTGHVTVAEKAPDPADFPDADHGDLVPGSLVFTPTRGPVPSTTGSAGGVGSRGRTGGTRKVRGAPSTAEICTPWCTSPTTMPSRTQPGRAGGCRTESEWEFAARGGLVGARYPWGEEFMPGGRVMANTWHGDFPWRNELPKKHGMTTPVGSYPPNAYGLVDVSGNVWEWTATPWTRHATPGTTGTP